MAFKNILDKIHLNGRTVSELALAGTLALGGMFGHSQSTPAHASSRPQTPQYENVNAFFQRPDVFNLPTTGLEKQRATQYLSSIYNTPTGKQLLDGLSSYNQQITTTFGTRGDDEGGYTDFNSPQLDIHLSGDLLDNPVAGMLAYGHECCHVQQKLDGMGCVNDLPPTVFDHLLAAEAEARMTEVGLLLHTSERDQHWATQGAEVDTQVYTAVKKGLMSEDGLNEKEADKRTKEEMLTSMMSVKNTDTINRFVSEKQRADFSERNAGWVSTYASQAAGQTALSRLVKPAYVTYPGSLENGIAKMAERLGVDESVLHSTTIGYDITNMEKDDNGNVLSGRVVSRNSGRVEYDFTRGYDDQGRLTSTLRTTPDGKQISIQYEYGTGNIPVKTISQNSLMTTTTYYNEDGTRHHTIDKTDTSEDTIWYQNDKKQKSILKSSQFEGQTETLYDEHEQVLESIIRDPQDPDHPIVITPRPTVGFQTKEPKNPTLAINTLMPEENMVNNVQPANQSSVPLGVILNQSRRG